MHYPPFTHGHRPECHDSTADFPLTPMSPLQLAAELRVQKLRTLFGLLKDVNGFSEAPLLREVFHNASELLDDAAALYRHAISRAQGGASDGH